MMESLADVHASDAQRALDRTLLLMRDHIAPSAFDGHLVAALTGVRVLLVADKVNVGTLPGQTALVTAALLAARAGARVFFDVADVALLGPQPPLTGDRLLGALLDVGTDLVPAVRFAEGPPPDGADLVICVGDTRVVARRHAGSLALRLLGDAWTGAMAPASTLGSRWHDEGSPFGALAASGLAAGEAYKHAMRALAQHALAPRVFPQFFAPTTSACVAVAPRGTPLPAPSLGQFDFISGGAVTHATLFALGRIRHVHGAARVIEPDCNDLTNINRYQLLRRSGVGQLKVEDLAAQARAGAFGGIKLTPVARRYDETTAATLEPFAPAVLVGVDHVPTRWAVQRAHHGWLGVGATDHHLALASFHQPGIACAGCLHPVDTATAGDLPTLAVVSHWAGLWLASLFVRHRSGAVLPIETQSVFSAMLQPGVPTAVWRAPVPYHASCPVTCRNRAA